MIGANKARLRATQSHTDAVQSSDVSFVIVPTPSDARGAFTLQYAAWAFREIGRALKEKTPCFRRRRERGVASEARRKPRAGLARGLGVKALGLEPRTYGLKVQGEGD